MSSTFKEKLSGWQEAKSPLVMGILNVTPDSFFDGGEHNSKEEAIKKAKEIIDSGADIIDVGGESTRPNADHVTAEEEIARVVPVITAIRAFSDITISIDTSKAEVMTAAVAAGANMINDVRALQEPGALQAAAKANVPVCIMHMKGQPKNMQNSPEYSDVTKEVIEYLASRVDNCCKAGISLENIIVDPGFGFGKTLVHNTTLLKHLSEFKKLQLPVLVGVSRKSMIGLILDLPVEERLYGSIAAAIIAGQKGAYIIRVHDVAATKQALKMVAAVEHEEHLDG